MRAWVAEHEEKLILAVREGPVFVQQRGRQPMGDD